MFTPSITEMAERYKEVWASVTDNKKACLEKKIKEKNALELKLVSKMGKVKGKTVTKR